MSQNPEFEETESFPWEEEMPQNYNSAKFLLSGFPQEGETITINSISFPFVAGATEPLNDIRIDDISTVAELRDRIITAVNANDSHCTASASGSDVSLSPDPGQPGSLAVSSEASNVEATGQGPDANGVIVIGS